MPRKIKENMDRKPNMRSQRLTTKEQAFVEAYLGPALGNGTMAMRIAGYRGSDNTLAVGAYFNIRKAKIKHAIEERRKNSGIIPRDVLGTLKDHLYADIGDFIQIDRDGSGFKLDLQKAEALGVMHVAEKVGFRNGMPFIRLYNSQRAAALLVQMLGLRKEKVKKLQEEEEKRYYYDEWISRLQAMGQKKFGITPERKMVIEEIAMMEPEILTYVDD